MAKQKHKIGEAFIPDKEDAELTIKRTILMALSRFGGITLEPQNSQKIVDKIYEHITSPATIWSLDIISRN